jgi:hypothetical protein
MTSAQDMSTDTAYIPGCGQCVDHALMWVKVYSVKEVVGYRRFAPTLVIAIGFNVTDL